MDIDHQATGSAADGNIVTIYMNKVLNNFKSKQEDDLVYDMIPFVRIVSPGQKHSIVDRKVRDNDKVDYKEHWSAFEKKEEFRTNGTPLRDWHVIEKNMIPELELLSIFTVEDFANVSDSNLKNIGPGAVKLREKAEKFVAGLSESDVKLQQAEDRIADLEAKLNELMDAKVANPVVNEETQDVATLLSAGQLEGNRGL